MRQVSVAQKSNLGDSATKSMASNDDNLTLRIYLRTYLSKLGPLKDAIYRLKGHLAAQKDAKWVLINMDDSELICSFH